MKNTKQLSAMAFVSMLVLTGCGATQEKAPEAPVTKAPEVTTPAPEVTATVTNTEATKAPETTTTASGEKISEPAAMTKEAPVVKTETLSYTSPAGPETMGLSLTVEGGKIIKATVTPNATNEISLKLQTAFAGNASAVLV